MMTKDDAIKVLGMIEAHGIANEAKWIAINALKTEAIPISFIENEKLRVNEMVIEAVHHSNYKEADRYAGVIMALEALICNWRREQDQYHED